MSDQDLPRGVIPPYGVAIGQAIAGGQLDAMRAMRDRAERWLADCGDLASALELLRAEIARTAT